MTNLKLPRRTFLHLAAGAAALPAMSRFAWAQSYPTRPVRIIVGFPAGTSSDITSRLIAQWLSSGSASSSSWKIDPVRAPISPPIQLYIPLLTATRCSGLPKRNAINATAYAKLDFNFIDDIQPVAGIIHVPAVMMVHPSVPAKTVPEFIAYAKAHPGKINMSTPGIGSINHVAGELFKMMAGVNLVAVHYRSSQFPDLLSGQVQVTFNPPAVVARIHTGWQAPRSGGD